MRRPPPFLLAVALALPGCGPELAIEVPTPLPKPVETRVRPAGTPRILAIADLNVARTARQVVPLVEYLEEASGVPLETGFFVEYESEIEALVAGRVQLAWLSPTGYVRAVARSPGIRPLVRPIMADRSTYRSVLIVRGAEPATDLAGLAGKVLAFSHPDSTSGCLFPRAWLAARGLDPDRHFARVEFAGSHENALQGVAEGRFDAAFVEDAVLRAPAVAPGSWRELATVATIPHGPIAVHPALPEREREAVLRAFLDYSTHPRARALVYGLQQATSTQAFRTTTDGDYDEVRLLAGLPGGRP